MKMKNPLHWLFHTSRNGQSADYTHLWSIQASSSSAGEIKNDYMICISQANHLPKPLEPPDHAARPRSPKPASR